MLTACPHCGARLRSLKPRCDACGADLVPYLTRSGANAASVLAPPSPAIASVDRQAPVAPPPDPAPDTPAGLSFDYTRLERPPISATLEMAPWRSVLVELRIAGGDGTHRCPQARVERRIALRQPGGVSGPRSRRCCSFHQ